MSSLDAVMIQGIRSFGPKEQDRGYLKFLSPLTLILGQNGCGKTTIIEALKYATTGEMPPGSSRGQSFVHDPAIAKEVTVKAQVKLLFTNVRGEKMTALRIFEGTQKAKTITMKTLDGTLTKVKANGESISVNKKCADMEAEMFIALGVTKPILNYVIFCHQEESNWPLDEGKKLKERFDAIFDATEYLKCIKNMRDNVKLLRHQVEIKKVEAASSKKDHTEAEHLKKEISDQKNLLASSEDKVTKCKADRDNIVAELRKLQKIEKEASSIETEKARQETRLGELKKSVSSLDQNLKRPGCLKVNPDVTEDELDEMMQELVTSRARKEREAARDEKTLDDIEKKVKLQKDEAGKLTLERGKLESEEERFRQLRRDRDLLVRELYDRHDGPTTSGELTEKDVRAAVTFMQESVRREETEQQRVNNEVGSLIEQAQAHLDSTRVEKTKLESNRGHKQTQLSANYAEAQEIHEQLVAARGSTSKLKELDTALAKIDAKLKSVKEGLNEGEVTARLEENEKKISALETEIRTLEAEKDAIHASLSVRKELSIHEENLTKKEGEIRRLMNKNADSFSALGMADVPQDKLSQHLAAKCTNLLMTYNKKDAELKRSQKQINSQEVTQRHLQERVTALERDLNSEKTELNATLRGADLETELTEISAQAADLEKHHGSLVAMQLLNARYVEKLELAQPCPLCHRDFESQDEAAELVDELKRKMDGLPREILEAEEKKRRAKDRYDDLLTLRPKQERLVKLRDSELPSAREQLEQAQNELAGLQQSHAELQRQQQEADRSRRLAEDLRTDVSRIDEREKDVRRLRADVDRLRAQLPARLSDRSVEAVGSELEAKRACVTTAREQRRSDETRLRQHGIELQKLGDERNRASAERLRLEKLQADQSQLERRREELEQANKILRLEVEKLEEEVRELETKCLEAAANREHVESDGQTRKDNVRSRVENIRVELGRLKAMNDDVLAYTRDNKAQKLMSVRQRLRDIAEADREIAQEKTRVSENVERIRDELRSQDTRKRDLEDHKELRRQQAEVVKLEQKVADLDRQLEGYDMHSVKEERHRQEIKHSRIMETVFSEEGAQKQIKDVIRDRSAKLSQDQFRNAESIYRQKSLELACNNLAMKDLQVYAKALDDAIIRFHSKRMERINMIIKELWMATYRGNDIDYIEIKTDQSTGDASKRTTYNYRVVMVKQRTELEMRGRCSAGQKVLASLIIRIALAETFGVNCGMLALDEPTTNLDRDNIQSLAVALEEIVRKRVVQKNFQLVIITHDEEFLAVLSRLDYVDRYYRVSRSGSGLSTITKRQTSEL
ncbi:DNA repair protein RAD50-like [Amphibalanus amphitrite]|uniref:DNA repair protein RAD50-like n=1 Tax=Amphibalanus amphitrite TaxID=1232801 RepID=UPI001C907B5D|nr:DNA repair protein RAD50-like [Amphibalanus amphitrite]XP_043232038.1 DNA repair protein RAD50-like [Amphibalanus amphitrite]